MDKNRGFGKKSTKREQLQRASCKFSRKENQEFWEKLDTESQEYSGDNNLVKIEDKFLIDSLVSIKQGDLLDVGCGKGQRTKIFSKLVKGDILGIDYSSNMIARAKKLSDNNLHFEHADIFNFKPDKKFDIITSCRCMINIPTDEGQVKVLKLFHSMLETKGHLILVERSIQGLDNLNEIRKLHGLKEIPERFHNHYINEEIFMPKLKKMFKIVRMNRLGLFYYISRVILPSMVYPKEPMQNHPLNKFAVSSQNILVDKLDEYGVQFMVHLVKK